MQRLINKKYVFFTTALIVFFLLGYFFLVRENSEKIAKNTQSSLHQRILRFSYEISNNSKKAIKEATFSSYLPIVAMANQQSLPIKTAHSFEEQIAKSGNHVAHFHLGLLPPFGKKMVKFVAQVATSVKPNSTPLSLDEQEKYLLESKFIEVNHQEIQDLSKQFISVSNRETLKSIYQWVLTKMNYVGYTAQDKGALYAIRTMSGDCTEYMYAVVALARASGIPARGIGGYVYNDNRIVSAADYHNWAEVYIEGSWRIVDAQKENFMENNENYIAMRILEADSVSLLGSSHRFSVANENLIVKMK